MITFHIGLCSCHLHSCQMGSLGVATDYSRHDVLELLRWLAVKLNVDKIETYGARQNELQSSLLGEMRTDFDGNRRYKADTVA
jgi:hypothetical protein